MSRQNLHATLDAVQTALEHLDQALSRGGFDAGSQSYQQMSQIVVAQQMWAASHEIDEFDGRFRTVARLADRVHHQLVPYVEAMDLLRKMSALLPPERSVAPDSDEAKLLEAIESADRPQSVTALRRAVPLPTSRLRPMLAAMADDGLITISSVGTRTRYGPVGS